MQRPLEFLQKQNGVYFPGNLHPMLFVKKSHRICDKQ